MSRKLSKVYKDSPKRILTTFIAAFALAVVVVVILYIILKGIAGSCVSHDEQRQQQYCNQLGDTLRYLYECGYEDEEAASYLTEHVEASGSSWAFLYDEDTVLFAKNLTTTKSIRDKADFLYELNGQDAVITTYSFVVNEKTYTVGIITDRTQFMDTADLSSYIIYIILLFAVMVLLTVGSVVALAGKWNHAEKELEEYRNELKERNEEFERVQKSEADTRHFSMTSLKSKDDGKRYKQYKFKFYLNARHAIYIDGVLGSMHPHTWEITLNVIKCRDDFIEFNKLERKIEEFMKQYQDKALNEVAPFDVINPTLENCCDYFKEQIGGILEQDGWILLMMEMSETPSRSYVISMIDEEDINQEAESEL